jgi:protein-S-isoprenylcysteine O-methyltransferase Ste14
MMHGSPDLILQLANLALIGALPKVFFRPGRFNAAWWLTSAPFFLAFALLASARLGVLTPSWVAPPPVVGAATLLSAASIFLIAYTLGTHRRPLALWHQRDDAQEWIVTSGAYARIRHPFYAAFLLGLLAILLVVPHWAMALVFAYTLHRLNRTAALEEARLLASPLGRKYARYRRRAGRFVPKLRLPHGWGSGAAHRPRPSRRAEIAAT